MSLGRPLVALALAAAVATLPGCGSDEPELPKEAARVFLDRALSDPPRSAQAAIDLEVDGSLLRLPLSITGEVDGPYETEPGGSLSTDLDFDLDAGGLGAEGSIVILDDTLYVVLFGENYRQPLGDEALRPLAEVPVELTEGATYAGVEEVGDTETARIEAKATVEVPVPAAGLGGEASLAVPELNGVVEAWVGLDDGEMRRLSFEARGLSVVVDLSELGEEFEFRRPEGGGFRPLSDLTERFGDFL